MDTRSSITVIRCSIFWVIFSLSGAGIAYADIVVEGPTQLREALSKIRANQKLKIAPGDYPGGYSVANIDNLTIEALDPNHAPRFKGGGNAWHFMRCNHLTLRNLKVSGQTGNGINLDDGGGIGHPVLGILLENIEVSDVGPRGNHDGIKCSGLEKVTIRDCVISGWGGEGIDFVGCHKSLVTGCKLVGKPGFSASSGVQMKGGSSEIVVEKCVFTDAGGRPVNVGGSTGLQFFRPKDANYEARNVVVRNCIFEGSDCAAAFVGVDGATFESNTILFPRKWIFRILQETRASGFVPCRNVRILGNKIVFRRSQVQYDINVGDATDPESFHFEGNHWFAEDRPSASKPKLPSHEKAGKYGVDPR